VVGFDVTVIQMPSIELNEAVDHIVQACPEESQNKRSPFFFLVGAGISTPPIPLSSEIIEDCKQRVTKRKRIRKPSNDNPLNAYSHWFQQAYPQPIQRQRYLRELIEDKPISPANLHLAHLLLGMTVTNLVVTTNFDDLLSRGLRLLGKSHTICDHPAIVDRIDPEQQDIQIIHVHGTYRFYDCCNLCGKIRERARPSSHPVSCMLTLLNRILLCRTPLVIGYGGWEGDVVMTALRRRLRTRLPHNIYWFCYQQADINLLPKWLRKHSQVYFVVAPRKTIEGSSEKICAGEGITQKSERPIVEKDLSESVLPAGDVFEKLIRAFAVESPALTVDPLKFFADHLIQSILMVDGKKDIYKIRSVISQIESARENYFSKTSVRGASLEKIRGAGRRYEYKEVINLASAIDLGQLEVKDLYEFVEILEDAVSVSIGQEEYITGCGRIIAAADLLFEELGDKVRDVYLCTQVAKALYNKSYALCKLKRYGEAIAVRDEVIERFGGAAEPGLKEQVARALVGKGYALGGLRRYEDEIAVYDEVIKRFGKAAEPGLKEQVARALVRKSYTLGELTRYADAIAVCNEVVKRFGKAEEPGLKEMVGRALNNKCYAFRKLQRCGDAIAAYDEVVKQFGKAEESGLKGRVAMALNNKSYTLGALKRYEEAIAVRDEVIKRFGEAEGPELKEQVARALNGKVYALSKLKRFADEIAVCDEVMKRFGKAEEPGIKKEVAKARYYKGIALDKLRRR
jgi:tetratricopeptide (TPR) repeat protein